jgi:pimeloyl-ACP methyl ester carboxylesterase
MRYKRVGMAILAVVGAILCLTALGAGFCAETLRVPRRVANDPSDSVTVEVSGTDNVKLSGWWLPSRPLENCVMLLHGIKDSRASSTRFENLFRREGYSILAPDSRAHGASGGEFVTYGLLEKYDAIAWAHWMRSQGCGKIYGLGESLGASILIQAASLEPAFSAIAAESPYADLQEVAEYRLDRPFGSFGFITAPFAKLAVNTGMLYARWFDGLDFRQVVPLQAIARGSTPILLIHGLLDDRTPPSQSLELANANPRNSLWLVPNAGHMRAYTIEPLKFCRRVLDWFAEH